MFSFKDNKSQYIDGIGLRSSKVKMLVKRESRGLFTFGSITSIVYRPHQNDPMINNPLLSYFTTILILEDSNPMEYILSCQKIMEEKKKRESSQKAFIIIRHVTRAKSTYMQGNIVKHANQLGRKVRVTGYKVSLLLHGCCNLKVVVVKRNTSETKTKIYLAL